MRHGLAVFYTGVSLKPRRCTRCIYLITRFLLTTRKIRIDWITTNCDRWVSTANINHCCYAFQRIINPLRQPCAFSTFACGAPIHVCLCSICNALCRSYIKKNTNTERTLVYIVWCKEKMTLNPIGTNCSLLLADLLLYSYEAKFLQKLVRKKLNHSLLPSNKHSGISTKHF